MGDHDLGASRRDPEMLQVRDCRIDWVEASRDRSEKASDDNVASIGEEIRNLSMEDVLPAEAPAEVSFDLPRLSPLRMSPDFQDIGGGGNDYFYSPTDWAEKEYDSLLGLESVQSYPFGLPGGEGSQFNALELETRAEKGAAASVVECGGGVGTSTRSHPPIAVYRRSNPRRAKSLRSNLKAKKFENGCSDAGDIQASVSSRIADRATRNRSSRRAVHRLGWGAVEVLEKQFEKGSEVAGHNSTANKIQDRKSKKGSSSKQKQRQTASIGLSFQTKGAGSSDVVFHDPLSRCGDGLQLQPSEALGLTSFKGKVPAGTDKITSEIQYTAVEHACRAGVESLCDNLHGEKDIESTLTQETHDDNMLAECPGVLVPSGTGAMANSQPLRPRAAWVLCDDCRKWRCIPPELADIIDQTDRKWTCKDNKDKTFADCSIPQEKTDSEINAELELSDGEETFHTQLNARDIESSEQAGFKPASWTQIKSNLFLHRNRKTQTIDEIMVCTCVPPINGSLGCGEECLNRMLNIECVRGTCPCGDLCSNQQFQKRKYAKFEKSPCGKKGHGLQLQENVRQGQFLIEYVGEVLDLIAYAARQRSYASMGQKHFYFMTLNGGEVIDACTKGNLGRFINHSCDPNCRTEKWMVNGEVCVGLFAIRDIKKGEEVTFNYQYVRVFGAVAKKCFCGAANCRGYIGGDPSNAEALVQGDSDEEYPESLMTHGHSEQAFLLAGTVSPVVDSKIVDHAVVPLESGAKRESSIDMTVSSCIHANVVEHVETPVHSGDGKRDLDMDETVSDTADCNRLKSEQIHIQNEQEKRCPHTLPELEKVPSCSPLADAYQLGTLKKTQEYIQTEHTMIDATSDVEVFENSSHSSNSIQNDETICTPLSDAHTLDASPGTSSINEPATDSVILDKKSNNIGVKVKMSKSSSRIKLSSPKVPMKKARPIAQSSKTERSKQVPTAISPGHRERVEEKLDELLDEHGGISNRKGATKLYLRLLFVTAAEGDNFRGFASQSTRDLSLILDALLKTKSRTVLGDIISKNGLQMLHNIMKQSQKDFKRTPILRKLLKVLEFLGLKGILTRERIIKTPSSGPQSFEKSMLILTKHHDTQIHNIARKLRDEWDLRTIRRVERSDRDDRQTPAGSVFLKPDAYSDNDEAPPGFESPCKKIPPQIPRKMLIDSGDSGVEEDKAPPGFDSPKKYHHPQIPSEASVVAGDVVVASLQERYLSHLTLSYGMPAGLVQQLGTTVDGGNQRHPCWAVAPGVIFHPFPPLPSYPRGELDPTSLPPTSFGQNLTSAQSKEEIGPANEFHDFPETGLIVPEAGFWNSSIRERPSPPFQVTGWRSVQPPFNASRGRWSQRQRWGNNRFGGRRLPGQRREESWRQRSWGENRPWEEESERRLNPWQQQEKRSLEEQCGRPCPEEERPSEEQSDRPCPEEEWRLEERSQWPCPQEEERPQEHWPLEEQHLHACPEEERYREEHSHHSCPGEAERRPVEQSQRPCHQEEKRPLKEQHPCPCPEEEERPREEQCHRPCPEEEEQCQRPHPQEDVRQREVQRPPSCPQEKNRPHEEQSRRSCPPGVKRPREEQSRSPYPEEKGRPSLSQKKNRPHEEQSRRSCPRGEKRPREEQSRSPYPEEKGKPRKGQSRHSCSREEERSWKGPRFSSCEEQSRPSYSHGQKRPWQGQSRHPWQREQQSWRLRPFLMREPPRPMRPPLEEERWQPSPAEGEMPQAEHSQCPSPHGEKRPRKEGVEKRRQDEQSCPVARVDKKSQGKGSKSNGASSRCISNKKELSGHALCLAEGVSNGESSTKYIRRAHHN